MINKDPFGISKSKMIVGTPRMISGKPKSMIKKPTVSNFSTPGERTHQAMMRLQDKAKARKKGFLRRMK